MLHDKPYPGTQHTYEGRLGELLSKLSIANCDFRRSLLRPGTIPLPECLWDWFAGIPGKSMALPYFAPGQKSDDDEREVAELTEDSEKM